jgi:hypothetical protein
MVSTNAGWQVLFRNMLDTLGFDTIRFESSITWIALPLGLGSITPIRVRQHTVTLTIPSVGSPRKALITAGCWRKLLSLNMVPYLIAAELHIERKVLGS